MPNPNNSRKYPCTDPFSKLFMIPRDRLYLRFCCDQPDLLAIEDYSNISLNDLNDIFNSNSKIKAVRQKFLSGAFKDAGCPDNCLLMSRFRIGAAAYTHTGFDSCGEYTVRRVEINLGPDCNIRCRYCMDTVNFNVNFGLCRPEIAEFIVPFVHNGGEIFLTGGETLLPKWGLVEKFRRLADLNDNKGTIRIITNGMLLNEEACNAILNAPVSWVGISMDTCKPELYNYIRVGADFHQVLNNALRLLSMRNKTELETPEIAICCAVLKSTADHLEETVNFFLNLGFKISLTSLFKSVYSHDFCERECLDMLSVKELEDLQEQIQRCELKWGTEDKGKLFCSALKGQLENTISQKNNNLTASYIQGSGYYAKRKPGVNPEIKAAVGNAKIFISYHKDGEILESEILQPIHVGSAASGVKLDMQRDDEGENISAKNDKYSEVTAQYWAWKNIDSDYYGFMHYRRHFAFREIPDQPELGGVVIMPRIDEAYKDYIGLRDNEIYACLKDYDIILPTPVDTSVWGTLSNEVQFSSFSNTHAVDFDLTCQTVNELYPEYSDAVEEFRNGKYAYWYNMFVMRKEIFYDYSEWLFNILETVEPKIDFTYFSEQEMRLVGYLAERLLGVFLIHLRKKKPDLKIKHLKVTLLKNTEKVPNVFPAFEHNNVPIAVSCNEYYMPFLGVMLNSLLENTSPERNYDILVMRNVPEFDSERAKRNINMLKKLVSKYPNAEIRFVDISSLLGNKDFYVRGNFTPETYFRLFLPQVLSNYEKIIYLDADTVVCRDIADLYDVDLDGAVLGAVRDPIMCGANKSDYYNKSEYMLQLGIKNIYDYFQAGVLLIDLRKISENGLCERMINYAATHDCDLVDQDVLNLFCQGKVKYIDNKWNVDVNPIAMKVVPSAPAAMWKEYRANRDNAYIYHFAGADKPWSDPALDKADIFWDAAKKTPWYEIILEDLIGSSTFFRRGIVTKSDPVLDRLSLWPDDVARMVLPIMKSFSELSQVGLSEALYSAIKGEDDEFKRLTDGRRVIFYGAGNCCKQILLYFDQLELPYPTAIWDRAARPSQRLFSVPVLTPDFESLNGKDDDTLCVITIESQKISKAVKQSFNESGFTNIIDNNNIMRILSRRLWLKLEEDRKA